LPHILCFQPLSSEPVYFFPPWVFIQKMFMDFKLRISCPPSPLPLFKSPTCTDTRTHMLFTHKSHHDLTTQALCHVHSLVWCTRRSLQPLGCSLKCSLLHSEGSCLHSNNSSDVLVLSVSFYQVSLKETHVIEMLWAHQIELDESLQKSPEHRNKPHSNTRYL